MSLVKVSQIRQNILLFLGSNALTATNIYKGIFTCVKGKARNSVSAFGTGAT